MDIKPALEHYNYDELGDCPCDLCSKHRVLAVEMEAAKVRRETHRYRCNCQLCVTYRKTRNAALAQANKRELYSELSYLTQYCRDREPLLLWILKIVEDVKLRDYWWAFHAEKRSMENWIVLWCESEEPSSPKKTAPT